LGFGHSDAPDATAFGYIFDNLAQLVEHSPSVSASTATAFLCAGLWRSHRFPPGRWRIEIDWLRW
jgi:hypothetical protein